MLRYKNIKHYLRTKQKTPYSNQLNYISIALEILEKMEPLYFMIYSIESNDHFILPDNSCFQIRGQLKNYPNNLINEITSWRYDINDEETEQLQSIDRILVLIGEELLKIVHQFYEIT
jgi:hypothetical protein